MFSVPGCRKERSVSLAIYSGLTMNGRWANPGKIDGKAIKICEGFYVDADHGGSLAQFINHGFPNCAFFGHLYRGFPVVAIIALENIKANTPLYLHYGPSYFNDGTLACATLNQSGISQYLETTQALKKIPFIECEPDGKAYFYGDRGKTSRKKTSQPTPELHAIDALANKIRLEYLATFHLEELKPKLDNSVYRWLKKKFVPKQ